MERDLKGEKREHWPIEFHMPFFFSWKYARQYVCEMLLLLDCAINVASLGIIETNISVIWYEMMTK